MRTFFLQLFLSFWIATIAIFVLANKFGPADTPRPGYELEAIVRNSSLQFATLAREDYLSRGCAATSLRNASWIITDADGRPLCGRVLSSEEQTTVQQARRGNTFAGNRFGSEWLHAIPITLQSGERWILLLHSPFRKPSWLPPFFKIALPLSVLVTLAFALVLTRPFRALSKAFRSFIAGDLDTRLPVAQPSRYGRIDSADVRTLMADFNTMADRVTELIDAHKLLIRDISHELRSPLARLRVALELAREESSLDPALFDQMEHETEKVNALIGEMLTLSLLESTRTTPRGDHFDLHELVMALLEDAKFEAKARHCVITFTSQEQNAKMIGQADMIGRAVENILRNAIRYTPRGGAIEVELSAFDPAEAAIAQLSSPGLKLSVRDTGPGIPLDHLSHIFRPFYRVDMARSESSGGFGVGLAIAERAIYLHRGRIVANNRASGGLDVQILLPCARCCANRCLTPRGCTQRLPLFERLLKK